jgi:hypothetical protein
MKKVLYLFVAILAATASFAQTKAPLEFQESKFSFGKVKQGVPVTHIFTFTNTSDKPVVIESASSTCGCTIPDYPKGAIAKGATGTIKVTYNAAATGSFTKPVTVKLANVADPIMLNIEGEVASTGTTGAATASTKAPITTATPKTKAAVTKTTTTKTATVKQ